MRTPSLALYALLIALLAGGQWVSSSEAALGLRLIVVTLPALIGVAFLLPPRPRLTASSLPMLLYFCIASIEWYSAADKLIPALITLVSSAHLLLLGGWGWRGLKAKRAAQEQASAGESAQAG